jgi:hypothetical protein
MSSADLFKGIAVVIDDEHGTAGTAIATIQTQIEANGGHVLGLKELPGDLHLANLGGASFFIVDWNLSGTILESTDDGPAAVKIPPELAQDQVEQKIKFLKELRKIRFAPVFIFTNEDSDIVKEALAKHPDLYIEGKPTHIFIEQKSTVVESGVSSILKNWIEATPSALVLKSWEVEYERAKNALFHDFYTRSVYWPVLLWQNFESDGVPPSDELGHLISRNLLSRMTPHKIDMGPYIEKVVEFQKNEPEEYRAVLEKVLEGERFLSKEMLHDDSTTPGDVFKTGGDYYLNIRPDCDCIARGTETDIDLYLLKGAPMKDEDVIQRMDKVRGLISERDNQVVIFAMTGKKSFCFYLNKIYTKKLNDLKAKRIGRLLPPFSTRVQQRLAAYLQRPGIPRIPAALISEQQIGGADVAQAEACPVDL